MPQIPPPAEPRIEKSFMSIAARWCQTAKIRIDAWCANGTLWRPALFMSTSLLIEALWSFWINAAFIIAAACSIGSVHLLACAADWFEETGPVRRLRRSAWFLMAKRTRFFRFIEHAKIKLEHVFEQATLSLFAATLLLGSLIPWILTSAASRALADDSRFVAFSRKFGRNPILLWRIGHGAGSEDGLPWFLSRDLSRLKKSAPHIASWIKKPPFWGDMIAFDAFGLAPIAEDAKDCDHSFVQSAMAYAERDDLLSSCPEKAGSAPSRARRL